MEITNANNCYITGLNKDNIKMNLSKVISDIGVVEKAMEQLENREITTTYKLTKVKAK